MSSEVRTYQWHRRGLSILFHKFNVTSWSGITFFLLCVLRADRALTSGGRDGTLRLWKIPEESQLVFQGNQSSADCCAMVNDDTFVSGHDDGKVYLWKVMKKKPVASVTVSASGEWITALSAVRSSDFVAAGSSCGYIALLMVSEILLSRVTKASSNKIVLPESFCLFHSKQWLSNNIAYRIYMLILTGVNYLLIRLRIWRYIL